MSDETLQKLITEVVEEVLVLKDKKIKWKTKKGKIKIKFSSSYQAKKSYEKLKVNLSHYLFQQEKNYQQKKAI